MSPRRTRPQVAMIGAGRLAQALLPLLAAAQYPIRAVWARRPGAARSAARGIPGARATTRELRALEGADLVLLAVPDRALSEMAGRLAAAEGWEGRVVLHHAGSLGPEALAPLARAGAAVGVLHPLQCLGEVALAAAVLPGSRARIEGQPAAVVVARRLARDLGLVPLRLPERPTAAQRAAYHAAASLVSNDLVALLRLGTALMQRAGLGADEGLEALLPLTRGTLAQLETGGFAAALTGPAVRGDVETLARHLKQLGRVSPNAARIHQGLALELVRLARSEGLRLPAGLLRRIAALER